MLWTNYKTWPVCKWATGLQAGYRVLKLVGLLLIAKSEVVLFRNQAKRFESWLNDLEAGWMLYKQPERNESCTIKLVEQTARGPNSIKVCQAIYTSMH